MMTVEQVKQTEADLRAKIARLQARQEEIDDVQSREYSEALTGEAVRIAGEIAVAQRALEAIPARRAEAAQADLFQQHKKLLARMDTLKTESSQVHKQAEALRLKLRPLERQEAKLSDLIADVSRSLQALKSDMRRAGIELLQSS